MTGNIISRCNERARKSIFIEYNPIRITDIMRVKPLFTAISLALATAFPAPAQFMQDLQDLFGRLDQQQRVQEKPVTVDYNIDFHYFFDLRDFRASDDLFLETQTLSVARFSPSAILRFNQGREATHRLSLGVDLTKDLGANPSARQIYSAREHKDSLRNTALIKDIFFYYNYTRRLAVDRNIGFTAGIFPRTILNGEYTRAIFADDIIYHDPNIEGLSIQYSAPRFRAELCGDIFDKEGVDRVGGEMVFTSGEFRMARWAALGWSAAYTHVRGTYIYSCDVDYGLVNPYLKIDLAPLMGMQQFYVKGAALASYQVDHQIRYTDTETGEDVIEQPHFPLGFEGTLGIRHWNLGFENTFYYGDNQMIYSSVAYDRISKAAVYAETLYKGEEFYFTRRSVPVWYNRAEVYWQPLSTSFVTARASAVGHFITPAGSDPETRIGPFVGFQAKATLLFNLDAFRYPRESAPAQRDARSRRTQRTQRSADGPLFSL